MSKKNSDKQHITNDEIKKSIQIKLEQTFLDFLPIQFYTEMILDEKYGELNETHKNKFRMIKSVIDKMLFKTSEFNEDLILEFLKKSDTRNDCN